MLQFKKLKLTGFKSFVDSTELLIELGLTGIVGPNGCGKSNLVEALKWSMGETSAKQMRGDEMEDIIFGGTESRPARNIAEVILSLDNSERSASSNFNESDELEVSRRIEKDKGSTYRINGKEVRAKDVQLLFADSATGARSTALVSQGRVSTVINAKPIQRRTLLEEAAGITGLHSRRHEAQLRLRAAETNIERLDDILSTLKDQLKQLKKQARQASRYKNLSKYIRGAEATLFYLLWSSTKQKLLEKRSIFDTSDKLVEELTITTAKITNEYEKHAATLPNLRSNEAGLASELHKLNLANQTLNIERDRIEKSTAASELLLAQCIEDEKREVILTKDAAKAISRLETEKAQIEASFEENEGKKEVALNALNTANKNVQNTDTAISCLSEEITKIEGLRAALNNRHQYLLDQREKFTARIREIDTAQSSLVGQTPDSENITSLEKSLEETEHDWKVAKGTLTQIEAERAVSEKDTQNALSSFQNANAEYTKIKAEDDALKQILSITEDNSLPLIIDSISVEPGYEIALGTALGDDLSVPEDENAPIYWQKLPEIDNMFGLPKGTRRLSDFVTAPDSLTRRLSQIGVIEEDADGSQISTNLMQGQRLVSRDGSLWRWDGFTITSGASTPASIRLEQRNRLKEISHLFIKLRENLNNAEAVLASARKRERYLRDSEDKCRSSISDKDRFLSEIRTDLMAAKDRSTSYRMEVSRLDENRDASKLEIKEITKSLKEIESQIKSLPSAEIKRDQLGDLRRELEGFRTKQLSSKSLYDSLHRETNERQDHLKNIYREIESWKQRNASSKNQLNQLANRRVALNEELTKLKFKPQELSGARDALLSKIETLNRQRSEASDALSKSETMLRETEKILKSSEADLANSRESMIRNEEAVNQTNLELDSIVNRIEEKLNCPPEDLFELSGLKEGHSLPELELIERKIDRLMTERDNMGPVNLIAEAESEEISQKINSLIEERDELVKAIEKLRQGINKLNKEGRQRILVSYRDVDKNFQQLFVKLFGGGKAHLKMTESDDPLESGLEIMASPPGKKLQILSLLSGGEQALTALSLLFAVFLTNPAPICVLDEVDAPLDDANVNRFCNMLEDMALKERTKFLIVTHHRLTMARMHRLFGVTMSERGISKLVSVDLQESEGNSHSS